MIISFTKRERSVKLNRIDDLPEKGKLILNKEISFAKFYINSAKCLVIVLLKSIKLQSATEISSYRSNPSTSICRHMNQEEASKIYRKR